MSKPIIHIFLPVHNRRDTTLRFVSCLKHQSYDHYHLILIDDGSKDETSEAVRAQIPDVTVIRGKGNWWWAGSLQRGRDWLLKHKISADDYVLIMNDDTEFHEDFLETGLAIMQNQRHTLLTATGYNLTTGQPQDPGGYKFSWKDLDCTVTHEMSEINCLSTRGMIARVGDFLSIGGFYPRLIPHYLSDLEFTMRAQERGLKLMIHPDFKISIDFDKTGYRDLTNETYIQYLLKYFSKRAAMNPIAWTNFIILRCPRDIKIKTLFKYWTFVVNLLFTIRFVSSMKNFISFSVRLGVRLIPNRIQRLIKKIVPASIKQGLRHYHDNVH